MLRLKWFLFLFFFTSGGWWVWSHNADLRNGVKKYLETGEVLTLEARYSPQQIVEKNKDHLLLDEQHTLQEPSLKFFPYLLMDVKYVANDNKTREGILLWGMTDGEIVINGDSWETSRGFNDALEAEATRNDYKLIQTLVNSRGGVLSREDFLQKLHVEPEIFEEWIQSAREKHFIVQKGNDYYLHFQDPKLSVIPQTKISQPLVTKLYNHAFKVSKKYSQNQIEKSAKAAFGSDFTIRSSQIVFLPVYHIEVLNPDGSILQTQWNALNGQRIYSRF